MIDSPMAETAAHLMGSLAAVLFCITVHGGSGNPPPELDWLLFLDDGSAMMRVSGMGVDGLILMGTLYLTRIPGRPGLFQHFCKGIETIGPESFQKRDRIRFFDFMTLPTLIKKRAHRIANLRSLVDRG